ncbi:MAG TPA: PQQ-binding-like beta-propeller repeat protein [Longimicrobium sp.]|nr:PQQ-binding-like beta-propeller repeat protein [Longimicrobium sp.]
MSSRWPRGFGNFVSVPRRRTLALVLACAVAAACGNGDRAVAHGAAPARVVAVTRWDTLWSVGGARDSTLLNPFLLSATDSLVYVYDGGARRLVALSAATGAPVWRFGRQGSGPGEFRGVRDIKRAGDGGVLVLDPRNNRITHLDRGGAVVSRIPLDQVGHAEQMAPLPDGRMVLLTMSPESAFAVVGADGRVQRRFSLPWAGFAKLDPIARQGFVAATGGTWVYGFSVGDGWYAFNGDRPAHFVGRYAEHTDFPKMETTTEGDRSITHMEEYNACSGCSLSISGKTLVVHFGGYGNAPKRTLDRFDVSTGKYVDSYQLPIEAKAVEATGDHVYVLAEDPYPVLMALRPRR